MSQQHLGPFQVQRVDPRPWRLRVMHQMYGLDAEHTCGTCGHLECYEYAKRYYKCGLTQTTGGPGTDWRTGWQACGRWEKREEGNE